MLTVLTNTPSLQAQRNLNNSQNLMLNSMKRLSSGLRINSASDDAAGMAISGGLESQIRGLDQANRNAGDGLSLLGTAEGSMEQQGKILQRMREIAVQSVNDTNSAINRTDLNNEVSQLKSELDRIARTTSFNGLNLLDGTYQSKDLQVGSMSTSNDRISVSFSSTKAADLGTGYKIAGTTVTANALAAGDLNIVTGGVTYAVGATTADGVSTVGGTYSALAKANAINAVSSSTGVTAESNTDVVAGSAQVAGTLAQNDLLINGVDIGGVAGVTIAGASDQAIVAAINSKFAQTGVTATLDANNKLNLNAADGRNITTVSAGTGASVAGIGAGTTTNRGTVTLRAISSFSLSGANETYIGGTDNQAATQDATNENIQQLDVTSKSKALLAIKMVDVALTQLNSRRATIGGLTNRLGITMDNLSSASQNAAASKSRIMDADFASETASMSRNQIMVQAGSSILKQANSSSQIVLSLLQ